MLSFGVNLGFPVYSRNELELCQHCKASGATVALLVELALELESGYLTTLYSCDDCQCRVPISCVRRQASDPWLTLTTVGESGDGALPGPLPDVGLALRWVHPFILGNRFSSTLIG